MSRFFEKKRKIISMIEEILIIRSDSDLLQAAFDLRHEVFVVEQGVPIELELDEHDAYATHILMRQHGVVIATLRLLTYEDQIKIGRVAVKQSHRRTGLGTKLMLFAIKHVIEAGFQMAVLDSQLASMSFYRAIGFIEEGDVFDDAGIPHIRMVLTLR